MGKCHCVVSNEIPLEQKWCQYVWMIISNYNGMITYLSLLTVQSVLKQNRWCGSTILTHSKDYFARTDLSSTEALKTSRQWNGNLSNWMLYCNRIPWKTVAGKTVVIFAVLVCWKMFIFEHLIPRWQSTVSVIHLGKLIPNDSPWIHRNWKIYQTQWRISTTINLILILKRS